MEIFKIIGVGIATTITVMIVKPVKPEIAIIVGLAGGIIMLLFIVDMLSQILTVFDSIVSKTGLNKNIFSIVLKIIGVGYITEFSASLCEDAGNSSVASKILLGGKILIMVIALPILNSLLELIMGLF